MHVRLIHYVDIPKRFHGEIMDICLRYVSSPAEPAAVNHFTFYSSKPVAADSKITNEVELIIEERRLMKLPVSTAGRKKFMKT
jgi:hypothetical protein